MHRLNKTSDTLDAIQSVRKPFKSTPMVGEATVIAELDGVGVLGWQTGKILIVFVVNFLIFAGGDDTITG